MIKIFSIFIIFDQARITWPWRGIIYSTQLNCNNFSFEDRLLARRNLPMYVGATAHILNHMRRVERAVFVTYTYFIM